MDFNTSGEFQGALELLQDYPFQSNEALTAALEALEFDAETAELLVTFLPMAFLRCLLLPRGVQFPPTCEFAAGWTAVLDQEPLFVRSMRFAQARLAEGMAAQHLQAVIRRSPEFAEVNQQLQDDVPPEEIELPPAQVGFQELEPGDLEEELEARPWWKLW